MRPRCGPRVWSGGWGMARAFFTVRQQQRRRSAICRWDSRSTSARRRISAHWDTFIGSVPPLPGGGQVLSAHADLPAPHGQAVTTEAASTAAGEPADPEPAAPPAPPRSRPHASADVTPSRRRYKTTILRRDVRLRL